jgi:DNA invertase Pin-like site-specific DNA recombinase
MRIGYARVSTAEQCLDLQIRALKEARCEKIFTEKQSGKDDARPVLRDCLASLEGGDTLVVWKLDRLARSTLSLATLVRDLQLRGIDFKSLTQPIDTTTSVGKLTFTIFSAIAEFEHDLIRERVTAGMAAAKARGVHCGRPRLINGRVILEKGEYLRDASKQIGVNRRTLMRALDKQYAAAHKGKKRPRWLYGGYRQRLVKELGLDPISKLV